MLSIQTNVNSLVAQQNLNTNSIFQSKTIQQLTSGYRINSSGDDAAGLAVANKYRSSVAELTQGVANGNDGVASLQIMDGGISNIGQMLDRLKTLAMQSASGSFTGGVSGRATLNSEFQTDLGEIDRQAQSIGLNTGGTFAQNLAVYLGSGSGSQSQANAVVNVDLSKSTVDTQSLGLAGYQAVTLGATTAADYDLTAGSATDVNAIVTDANNTGTGQFTFTGAGFGDANGIQISPNLTGVNNTTTLVAALNAAIQTADTTQTTYAAAFKAANITASIHTDSAGQEQLAFNSSNSAFQVKADDLLASGLMGNITVGNPDANAITTNGAALVASGAFELGTAGATVNTAADITFTAVQTGNGSVTINANDSSGNAHALTISISAAQGASMATVLARLNGALQGSNDTTLEKITAVSNGAGSKVNFISNLNSFSVAVSAATTNGITATTVKQALQVGSGGVADISTIGGAQAAVTAISSAVTALGSAQAGVGKGENQLNFAISLAQSQITNFSAAESNIRDANVAQEAANLTKAQVLQQASIAAMAQANSAPQAVLTLLRG